MNRELDAAVIGGGPGGLVAALYLARFRRHVGVFTHGRPRAYWIPKTHNLVGYDKGISGPALLRRLHRQVRQLSVPVFEEQAKLEKTRRGWRVVTSRGAYEAKTVVLATGVEDTQPEIPNLAPLRYSGHLRYCPVCDGFEFRDARIFVLVTDQAGLTRARFIRRYSKTVHAVMVRERPPGPGEKRMAHEAGLTLSHATRIELKPVRNSISLAVNDGPPLRYDVGYVEMGCRVRDEAFAHLRGLRRTTTGFLITDKEQRLSLPGLFAVGDCVHSLGQISVAAGQAAIAASAIHADLLKRERSR